MTSKAISPMIATILLIAFTIAVAGILLTWGSSLISFQSSTVGTSTEKISKCGNSVIQVKEVRTYGDIRSGLVGYWKLDEGSGSAAIDNSGNGYTGIVSGTWVTGSCKFGTCLSFSSNSENVTVAHNSSLNLDVGTIELWLKSNNPSPTGQVIYQKSSSGLLNAMYTTGDGKLIFRVGNLTGVDTVTLYSIDSTWANGNWHHIAGVLDKVGSTTYMKLFIDGVLHNSTTIENFVGQTGTNKFFMYGNLPYNLDEVKIFNRALASDEILKEYQYQRYATATIDYTTGIESLNNLTTYVISKGQTGTSPVTYTSSYLSPGQITSSIINLTATNITSTPELVRATVLCSNSTPISAECKSGQPCMIS